MMKRFFMGVWLFSFVVTLTAQEVGVDPNFYIYLCFGQSNMEGQATPESVDLTVDERFKMLATQDFDYPRRLMGEWYVATPPIVRQWAGLGMADYFGRTLVAALPADVKVGVVDVAVGGIAIEGFMPDKVEEYLASADSWLQTLAEAYGNDPYARLVEMGRVAQKVGVIKGILLHQGESNNGQMGWLESVKQVYESLLQDLSLSAEDVPLLVGETVNADVGGVCSLHNTVISQLPAVIPTAHVIESNGCPCAADHIHFTAAGYRTMGKRYAYEALRLLGYETLAQADYAWNDDLKSVYMLKNLDAVEGVKLGLGGSKTLSVWGTFGDGHREDLSNEVVYSSDDFNVENGVVVATEVKSGTVTASYTDFLGQIHEVEIPVDVVEDGPNHVLVVANGAAGANQWEKEAMCKLSVPMEQGKTYVIRVKMRSEQSGDCSLWPRWDGSANRDQWGNSADIQYLATHDVGFSFQELIWRCQAKFPHDVLIFAIGKLGGNVYFDDVSCKEEGSDMEMVVNGNFEGDNLSAWSVLSWTGQTLSIVEDVTTAVRQVKVDGDANDVYDLSGRRVLKLSKGVYIVNGKVVLFGQRPK